MSDLDEKIAAIRAGLDGVTPGPWVAPDGAVEHDTRYQECCGQGNYDTGECCSFPVVRGEFYSIAIGVNNVDGAHIARLDPDTVRAILDRLGAVTRERDRLRAENERMREALTKARSVLVRAFDRIHVLPRTTDTELSEEIGKAMVCARAALNGEGE